MTINRCRQRHPLSLCGIDSSLKVKTRGPIQILEERASSGIDRRQGVVVGDAQDLSGERSHTHKAGLSFAPRIAADDHLRLVENCATEEVLS